MARPTKARVAAIAYLRTSSATNVGADKDSDKRERQAIEAYAKQAGHELVGEFYDAAVSGADPIETRPGLLLMLDRIEGNGVRTVLGGGRQPLSPRAHGAGARHPVADQARRSGPDCRRRRSHRDGRSLQEGHAPDCRCLR